MAERITSVKEALEQGWRPLEEIVVTTGRQTTMQYVRTFNLQAAHLNSALAYQIVWTTPEAASGRVTVSDMMEALRDCHGHNFKIEIVLEGGMSTLPWLVDDVRLTELVMQWDNTNLSLHEDFFRKRARATTENMAAVLITKLRTAFGSVVKSVKIWETPDIYALAT